MRKATIRYRSVVADSARWEGFPFREGDIVISTPSKCGTTWMQMLCALLIFQTPDFDRPLAEISPWLDMLTADHGKLVAALEAQPHRRFIKTHTPLDGLPLDDRVTYVCVGRDPRDAGFSWSNHRANFDMDAFFAARSKAVGLENLDELLPDGPSVLPPTEIERFWQWADGTRPVGESPGSLAALLHHVRTFWPATAGAPNLVLLHYDDLQADLDGQMRYLARRLGIDVPEQRWPELVPAARFDQMRRRADDLVPNRGEALWHDNAKFFHRGTSGQWRTRLNEDDLRRYHLRVAQLGDPEVAGWVHRDPGASRPLGPPAGMIICQDGRMAKLWDDERVTSALEGLTGWQRDDDAIVRTAKLPSFPAAIEAVRAVAEIAESRNHHPDIDIRWRTVTFRCSTHSEGGITGLDIELASEIDRVLADAV